MKKEAPPPTPADEEGWDFFISYTEADHQWAEWVAWTLEEAGYTVLVQAWDFVPGSNWIVGMERGMLLARHTLAVISSAYLGSVYGQAEWMAAFRVDPQGMTRRLIPIRVEEVERPGILHNIVSIDLFDLGPDEARSLLLNLLGTTVLGGRARPTEAPIFPRPAEGEIGEPTPPFFSRNETDPRFPTAAPDDGRPIFELGDVFISSQIPGVTFVQQRLFVPFKMKLRQPGLGIVVEGAAGLGKTTLLRHAIEQDSARFTKVDFLTAREPKDVNRIRTIVTDGHDGIVVIDDFHRLPDDVQGHVVDYLKKLADQSAVTAPGRGTTAAKIVVVGISDTARSMMNLSPDIAPRIFVLEPEPATPLEVSTLVELGERALNIEFDDRQSIIDMASGSLIVAQQLCWWLATLSGVEETARSTRRIRTDIEQAARYVHDDLRKSFSEPVAEFVTLDGENETICADLLLELAHSPQGAVSLDRYLRIHPEHARTVDQIFLGHVVDQLTASRTIAQILYYDIKGSRLVADNPQFWFYLKLLSRERLLEDTGKRSGRRPGNIGT